MKQNRNIAIREPAGKERNCLGCGGVFATEGPHNRICPGCKAGEEWQSGAAGYEFLRPWANVRDAANDNDAG